jgi:beta-galactosidase
VFREVSDLGATLAKLDDVVGSYTKSEVAFVYDWENWWALDGAAYFKKDKKYAETHNKHYNEFYKRGINVDFISYNGDFSPYKIVVIPMMYSVPEKFIKKIESYVRGGGRVVTTYGAAMVNENCLAYLGGLPALELKDVFGVWNEEISCMNDGETVKVSYNGKEYDAIDYCEVIHDTNAKVLGRYEEDYFKDMPAVCENSYGEGKAYYIAFRDTGEFLSDFYDNIINDCGIEKFFEELPWGVSGAIREDETCKYVFLHNFAKSDKVVKNSKEFVNMETGEKEKSDILVPSRSAKILRFLK